MTLTEIESLLRKYGKMNSETRSGDDVQDWKMNNGGFITFAYSPRRQHVTVSYYPTEQVRYEHETLQGAIADSLAKPFAVRDDNRHVNFRWMYREDLVTKHLEWKDNNHVWQEADAILTELVSDNGPALDYLEENGLI